NANADVTPGRCSAGAHGVANARQSRRLRWSADLARTSNHDSTNGRERSNLRPERSVLRQDAPLASIRVLQEALDQPVGAAAVGEGEMAGEVAWRGGEIETLVLLVAAGQRAAGEIPSQPEDADALFRCHALGAGQVAVDQRPQVLVGHLRRGWRGEHVM